MFNTHVDSFNGDLLLQKAGGPLGLRSTCAVARVTMNEWDARWQEILRLNNIKIREGDCYMDDIRAFLNSLKAGSLGKQSGSNLLLILSSTARANMSQIASPG